MEVVDEDKWRWEEKEYVRQKVGGENRKGREEMTERQGREKLIILMG